MLASELIDPSILPILPEQTCAEALASLQDQALRHGVVIDNDKVLAVVSEDWLMGNNADALLSDVIVSLPPPPVLSINQSELEALKAMSEHQFDVLPLVDENDVCVGMLSLRNTFHHIGKKIAPPMPGGILVIEVHPLNYQLSEIAQIVESGDALIHALYVESINQGKSMLVTIFTNKEDLDGVVQTFNRYNYNVLGTFYQSVDRIRLKERFDSLMRYLNT